MIVYILEKIDLDKTEVVLFSDRRMNGLDYFFARDGILYETFANDVVSERRLTLHDSGVKLSTCFKYIGNAISGVEGLRSLEHATLAHVSKNSGALGQACKFAVALSMSCLVDLHQSLVAPIALLNCIQFAWFPFLARGRPWILGMNE